MLLKPLNPNILPYIVSYLLFCNHIIFAIIPTLLIQAQVTFWIFHFMTLNQKSQPHINNRNTMVRDNASVFDALTTSGRKHYKSQDQRAAAM